MNQSLTEGKVAAQLLAAVSIKTLVELAFVLALVSFAATRAFHPFQRGALDAIGPDRIAGWAYDPTDASAALRVQLFVDGVFVAETLASEVRHDLVSAGAADKPEHGFTFSMFRSKLAPGQHFAQVYAVRSSVGGGLTLVPILKDAAPFVTTE